MARISFGGSGLGAQGPTTMSRYATAGICSALVLLTAVILWIRVVGPSDGTSVQLSKGTFHGDRMTVSSVLDDATGLRSGDVVTAIDGIPLRSYPPDRPVHVGSTLTYTVLRDGDLEQVTFRLQDFPVAGFLVQSWPSLLTLLALLATAVFVFHARAADPAAQALMLVAFLAFCGTVTYLLGDQAFRLAAHGPTAMEAAGELALALMWGAIAHFSLVAPGTGLTVTRRRIVVVYSLPLLLHGIYLAWMLPSARSTPEVRGLIAQFSLMPSLVLPLLAAVLLFLSYRATSDIESRRRVRWVLLALALGGLAFLAVWGVPNLMGWPVPPSNLMALIYLPPPVALSAAILRYRLFDVEVIVRRSLLYGSLTASVVGIYLAGAWVLSRVFVTHPTLAAVLAGGLIGLIAPPLHSFLRRRVGRLVYGERDDPFKVLSRLGRIDAAEDPRLVLQTVVETVAQTLRLPFAAIELRRAQSRFAVQVGYGRDTGRSVTLPLALADGVRGRLTLAVSPGQEPFGPADRRLLDTLARQVSGAASMVLLTNELQQSREQIVLAREEERRRLHHRIHDGLGPNLAAGIMRMEAARELLRRNPDAAGRHLDEQIALTRSLIGDIRGLVYNLRPPALDQLGLAGALRERTSQLSRPDTSSRMQVLVAQEGDLGDLPAAVEVAAFWISVEAVNNAIRHAQASLCRVRLARGPTLSVRICDNGRGLPERVRSGGGLISMRERAEELRGTCRVYRGDEGGTVVEVHLPIREAVTD
ncbi:histidine kinase [Streptomyces minutiscleroticus]|uniref:histidine kinase n=1 Tax=Streptomyces minutiscleroticus TaxID=68238 RepID=UPI00331BF4F4